MAAPGRRGEGSAGQIDVARLNDGEVSRMEGPDLTAAVAKAPAAALLSHAETLVAGLALRDPAP